MAHKVDPYEGIDFEEINEATDLADDEIKCLKNCFDLFDSKKQTFLSADDLDEILRAMGFRPSAEELKAILEEIDEDGSGEIEFAEFCQLCAKFLVEDPDIETLKRELKAAFRFLYFCILCDCIVMFLLIYSIKFFQNLRQKWGRVHHYGHIEGVDLGAVAASHPGGVGRDHRRAG